jgi:Cu2+-containing amine oxidase
MKTKPPAAALGQDVTHPLDPLTADEIGATIEALRSAGRIGSQTRLVIVRLNEPP